MKVKIVFYKPKESDLNIFDKLTGYSSYLPYDEEENTYKIKLVDEFDNILYTFSSVFIYYKTKDCFIARKEEIQEKLKEYDNPETEIIFDNSESND